MSIFDWIIKEKEPEEPRELEDGTIRQRIRFHGRVQGVGFRYTATAYANDLRLTGWVRNEDDGTVLMEVQGREEAIEKLIQLMESGRYIEITRVEKQNIAVDYHESRFGSRW